VSDETDIDPRREMWRAGSYEIVGDWFRDASTSVLDGIDLDGRRLLDVASGTGAVAIEAARRGAAVVGVDLTPELLAVARRRAANAGVDVDVEFVHDDFDHFTRADDVAGAFDVVTSSFGVIFAPDPPATARSLVRVAAPGGTIAICAWATTGLFGTDRTATLAPLMPPAPPGALDRPWSSADGITALFAGTGAELVEHRAASIGLPFASIDDTLDQFERWSGPWQSIFAHFRAGGTTSVAHDALVEDFSRYLLPAASGVVLRADYVVSVLRRAS
jgi:SAM-dependent methyltransferase